MPNQLRTDAELLSEIKTYLAKHQFVTRGELRRKLNTSVERIERVASAANLPLPEKLSRSAGATLGRKKSGTCKNWYITRPAPWQTASI